MSVDIDTLRNRHVWWGYGKGGLREARVITILIRLYTVVDGSSIRGILPWKDSVKEYS